MKGCDNFGGGDEHLLQGVVTVKNCHKLVGSVMNVLVEVVTGKNGHI